MVAIVRRWICILLREYSIGNVVYAHLSNLYTDTVNKNVYVGTLFGIVLLKISPHCFLKYFLNVA